MKFQVICSTADGNQTKDFSNWESAHQYANEWMDGFTHWNHLHFNNVESSEYVNLWKTRKGDVVKIQEVKSICKENTMNQKEIENARIEIENCEKCNIARQYADNGETMLCNAHYKIYSGIEGKILVTVNCPNCADQASIAAPGQTVLCKTHDKENDKVWWDDEKGEYNTIDYAIQKQWQNRLQTLREKSVAEINFIDALDSVITRDEYRSLTDDQQRELIQAWLYPDNNEIDELTEEIPTDVHYEPNHPNLSENNEVQDLTSIEFFVANVKSYHASVFGVYCSNCFESESTLAVTTNNYTMFEFCKPCYDKLKRAMIARDARS